MKAVWYERCGPAAEVLTYGERPTPVAGRGEVRVRLEASGVNPADVGRRAGSYRGQEFPLVIPNSDGAGIIDQVGDGVTRLKAGQRVWLFNGQRNGRALGTAAEYIALAEQLVTPLPDQLSFAQGATLGISAMTAWCCLFADGPIAGKTVLVTGGAGAVGNYAVQLAKWGGARVIATVSSDEKAELARKAGARTIVNYRADDCAATIRAAAPEGVDRIVEVAPAANAALDAEVIAPNGVVAIYAADGDLATPVRPLMVRNVALRFVLVYNVAAEWLTRAVDDVSAALAAGDLSELPAHRFALDDIAAAHEAVESGAVGKVLVDID